MIKNINEFKILGEIIQKPVLMRSKNGNTIICSVKVMQDIKTIDGIQLYDIFNIRVKEKKLIEECKNIKIGDFVFFRGILENQTENDIMSQAILKAKELKVVANQ